MDPTWTDCAESWLEPYAAGCCGRLPSVVPPRASVPKRFEGVLEVSLGVLCCFGWFGGVPVGVSGNLEVFRLVLAANGSEIQLSAAFL